MEITVPGKAPEIYAKLKSKFDDYKAQGKLKQMGDVKWNDSDLSALASGTGFKSTIKCLDGKVVVDLDLNFLLKPMRGQIEEGIQKMVGKAFA